MLLALLSMSAAYAAGPTSASTTSNLSVSPAIEQLNLSPNQDTVSFQTTVVNNSSAPATIQVQMSDFTALNTTGSVSFLGTHYKNSNLHGLAQSMHVANPTLVVGANSNQTVPITITNASHLAPGGHYGAVIFKILPTPTSLHGSGLSTNEEVSVLVFLTTSSGRTQTISLSNPQLNTIATKFPSTLNLDFANTGNTQTTPHGIVTLTNNQNQELARGIINVDSGLVLPATDRLYQVNLIYSKHTFTPGWYKLHVTYQADAGLRQITYTKRFFYLSRTLLWLTVLLVLLALATSSYLAHRGYKKYRLRPKP